MPDLPERYSGKYPGKLIACEGLDCSGKTTAIQEVLKEHPEWVYSKGMGSDTLMGRLSRKFPSTLTFLVELLYVQQSHTLPSLEQGRIVLQDRHELSISSYVPLTGRWHNRTLIEAFHPLIVPPDALIYFTVPLEERIRRLKEKGTRYEMLLAEAPELITLREAEYVRGYEEFKGFKTRIDTGEYGIKETAERLGEFVGDLVG